MELLERSDALAAMASALAAAGDGNGQVALLSGDAGLGKTALIRQFVSTATPRVLMGAADDLLTPIPLGPIVEMSRQGGGAFEIEMAEGPSRDRAYGLLLDELERRPHPVMVVVDDVHWADEATLDVLSLVARQIDRLPVLLALAFRPAAVGADHHLHRLVANVPSHSVQRIHLEPLSRAAVARMVTDARADAVFSTTGGNPFFLTALLDADEGELPATVSAAVIGRLGRMDVAARNLVRLVAMAPGGLEAAVLDVLDRDWSEYATETERQGLLTFEAGMLRFQHELARRAVVESLSSIEARKLHMDVIRGLKEIGGDPARLVHHAAAADDTETLFQFAGRAGRRAAAAGAHREAVDYLRRYLEFEDRIEPAQLLDMYELLVVEAWAANLPMVSGEAADHALSLQRGTDPQGAARSLRRSARAVWFSGDADGAIQRLDEAIALLDGSDAVGELASANAYRALIAGTSAGPDAIEPHASQALDLLASVDDSVAAQVYDNVGTVRVRYGLDDGSMLQRALELARATHSHVDVVRVLANKAATDLDQRDVPAARDALEAADRYADEHRILAFNGYIRALRAQLHELAGEWAAAEQHGEWVVSTPSDVGFARIPAAIVLTRLEVRRGSPEAGSMVDELWDAAAATQEPQWMLPAAATAAEQAWMAGSIVTAGARVAAALQTADASVLPWVAGDLVAWARRAGIEIAQVPAVGPVHSLQLAQEHRRAASEWEKLGLPFHQALALADSDHETDLRAALGILDQLDAPGTAARLRSHMRDLGVTRIPKGRRASSKANPGGLTNRQVDVLALVAQGLTNAEIADRLFVSVRTVDHHVSAILMRLDVSTRRDAGRKAGELGIT